ncbi:MAG: MBL fold metallo-hydrolase [Nanoarchaeota archaeon]|nr:MBL fold metallo-hydrolase [Nanoarchaeota archaeon]
MASLHFLGTGTGAGVVGKGLRSSGGIVLKLGLNQFLIDPGVGAVIKAAEFGVSLRETTAILLSHTHTHHANDVNAVIEAMSYDGLDKKGVLIANKTALNGTEEYPAVITPFHRALLERFIAVDRNMQLAINDVEIRTLTARHNEPNSIGFKFIHPDATVVYSGDTVYSLDLVEQYLGADILILNVPYKVKTGFNLCLDDAAKILERVKPRLAVFTHFANDLHKADPLYEVREIHRITGVQCLAAKDGMEIQLSK